MDLDLPSRFWPTLPGLLGGWILGTLTSGVFAWRSSKELMVTHRQVVLLLRALEGADVVQFNRNEAGDATGVVINLSGAAVGTSHMSADLTVERAKQPPSDGASNIDT